MKSMSSRIALLLLITALCRPELVLAQSEPCQSLLEVSSSCTPLGNCSGLVCSSVFSDGSGRNATFIVTKCKDPVLVDLTLESSAVARVQQRFNQSGTGFYEGSGNVSVAMQRNASHLQFQASLSSSGGVLIPEVYVPLNASDCMCESLSDLADVATHDALEPECSTNERCDGIRCEIDIIGFVYYIEIIVNSCDSSLSLLVEDSGRNVLHRSEFNQTATKPIQVGILSLQTEVTIVKHDYSMEVEAYVTEPIYGRVKIIPRHTIILDKTNCTSSPVPTVTVAPPTAPPPPPPPPSSAPPACHAFFAVINSTRTESFMCVPLAPCERGITCRLAILDTDYHINISLTTVSDVSFSVTDGPSSSMLSSETSTTAAWNTTVSLPKPSGGSLVFNMTRFDITSGAMSTQSPSVNIKLSLLVPDLASSNTAVTLTTTLIPFSNIPIFAPEQCQILSQYDQLYPQCTALGTCSGAQCQVNDNYLVTFAVTKCLDPVVVDVTLRSIASTGEVNVQRSFNHSDSVFIGGSSLYVEMGRNATDLRVEATLTQPGSANLTAIPQATVPLNASQCMCSSLQDLASRAGGTLIEPECHTNNRCDGMVCEIDVFGNIFFIETIILPCIYAVDVVIEDEQGQPTFMTVYNQTDTHVIDLGIFSTNLYVVIIRHAYSMEISAVVDTILFGNLTLVPHHTVILDKTSCDLPHIKPIAPPITPPPPTAPPTSAPEICHTFYDIIQATAEPLVCMQMKDCTMGIQCTLEVLDTYYTLNITVLPSEKAFMFSVADSGQKKLGSAKSKNTTVSLPKPPGSSLIFNQTVSGDKKSIGFSLAIATPNLGSDPSRLVVHSLIAYTEVPITESQGAQVRSQTTSIAIGVTVLLLLIVLAIVVVVGVWGCVIYCKRRDRDLAFSFKYMKDEEDKEALDSQTQNSEDLVDTDEKKLDLGTT